MSPYHKLKRKFTKIAIGIVAVLFLFLLVVDYYEKPGRSLYDGPDRSIQTQIVKQEWEGRQRDDHWVDGKLKRRKGAGIWLDIDLELKNAARLPVLMALAPSLVAKDGSSKKFTNHDYEVEIFLWPGEVHSYTESYYFAMWNVEDEKANPLQIVYDEIAEAEPLHLYHQKMQERLPISPLPAFENLEIINLTTKSSDSKPNSGEQSPSRSLGLVVSGCTCNIYRNGVLVSSKRIPVGASCLGKVCSGN